MNHHQKDFRVLIIGCGQLGSRHLQAVASLPVVSEIEVVDPRPEALEIGRRLLEEIPQRQFPVTFRWISSVEEGTPGGHLCIVATQAEGRFQLLQQAAELLGYRSFLLEKIVTQSTREYEECLQLVRRNRLQAWVNCKTRAYPVHKWIKKRLNPEEPILFNAMGGNHGLANNGIHEADLFTFYDGNHKIEGRGSSVDSILHPCKRGRTLFDLSGTLMGVTSRGSHFTLSFAPDHVGPDHISVVTKSYRWIIDHMSRWAYECDMTAGGTWKPIPFEGNLLVSHMTRAFAMDILTNGRCELPTLEECAPAHEFILSELLPHFNRLLKKNDDICPVT